MKIAIVTGASSGLGRKYVETVENKYPSLDEVWVIARRKERLLELEEKYPNIRPIALDLADEGSYERLSSLLDEYRPDVRLFINNAGYEKSAPFGEMEHRDILGITKLNVVGFTLVARAVTPYLGKGSVAIMVCSVSSFAPVPGQAVYSASKAYVKTFISAYREEVKGKGVKVLNLSPSNMDTEMNPKGESRQSSKISKLPFVSLETITEKSLKKAEKGKKIYVPGNFYKGYRLLAKMMPSCLMAKIAGRMYR